MSGPVRDAACVPDRPPAGRILITEPPLPADVGLRVEFDAAADASSPPQVATITLCRPERRNPQSPAMWQALVEIARTLPATVRVVVLRADGPSFSAGLDRALFDLTGANPDGVLSVAAMSGADAEAAIASWQQAFDWRSRADLVSVAAVQGHAVGAGFQLALGCDLRVLASDASLAMAEARLGLVPDLGGTKRLHELVGYSRAAELCLTGRPVLADEALAMGLASAVVAPDDLDGAVARVVDGLLAVDRDAAAEIKALLLHAGERDQAAQQAAERQAQYRRFRALAGLDAEDEPTP